MTAVCEHVSLPRVERGRTVALAAACGLCALCVWLGLIITVIPARAESFYDQPPMTGQELLKFIDDLPVYRAWARKTKELAHPGLSKEGRPTFIYSDKAAAKVRELGWEPKRFFCVMGRAAAALAMQERGNPGAERPVDMPVVTPSEFNLVRRHGAALTKAGDTP